MGSLAEAALSHIKRPPQEAEAPNFEFLQFLSIAALLLMSVLFVFAQLDACVMLAGLAATAVKVTLISTLF